MATPETFRALLVANSQPPRIDFSHKTRNLCDNLNEFLYKLANEPSLAGHRIQEHVYKTVPTLVKEEVQIETTIKNIHGIMFDLDYTDKFLNKIDESILNSSETRETISELASKISSLKAQSNTRS